MVSKPTNHLKLMGITLFLTMFTSVTTAQKSAVELSGKWECRSFKDSTGIKGITASRYYLETNGKGFIEFFDPLMGVMNDSSLLIMYRVEWLFDPSTHVLTLVPTDDEYIETLYFTVKKFRRNKRMELWEESSKSSEYFKFVK